MTDMTIAKTILQQLGGNQFAVMTGSKNFAGYENALSFQVGRNSKGVNRVRVTLNSSDLYDVEFFRIRKNTITTIAEAHDIYCDQLDEVFEQNTGLYTHL